MDRWIDRPPHLPQSGVAVADEPGSARAARGLKLIIQIPCLDEEQTLARTLDDLPREVQGFDSVEILVIDDGSHDRTSEIARAHGAHHVVRHNHNQGLARAFMHGLRSAADHGADVIVNTDADNQYRGCDVERLVQPIVEGKADIVVGARPVGSVEHFSPVKRLLQKLGSRVVRALSGTAIHDAPSGFRAMTREAALRLNVFSKYTYTLETIIQAGISNLRIVNVPIDVNEPTRPSRLMSSTTSYVWRSVQTLLSVYLIYRPIRLFGLLSFVFLTPGFALGVRYLYFRMIGEGQGHVQSVIVGGVLIVCGIFMLAIAIVGHLQAINRRLLEELRYEERLRRSRENR